MLPRRMSIIRRGKYSYTGVCMVKNREILKESFIYSGKEFVEGEVSVFEQELFFSGDNRITLTITALGMYEAELNGKKVGDIMFAPGYTYYPNELQAQEYDITDMLSVGKNTLRIYLAQGWYCGRFTYENKCKIYGDTAAVSWVASAEDKIICTSRDENVILLSSPYEYAGIYDGEIYRADVLRKIGKPTEYNGKIPPISEGIVYTKIFDEMPVVSVREKGDVTILDFGQNFAGIVEINPQFMKGDCIKLRHGELLNADGSLYTTNLRNAKAEIAYHKGADSRIYRSKFTFMGFRYVELSGEKYVKGLISAHVVHSAMERTGYFECDNVKLNRLYLNQLWGQRSNYLEVPTDCPQRDERMGYTGDCQVFARTGAYNYDTERFLCKFLGDIRESQKDNSEGYVGPVIPALGKEGIGFINMLGWGNAVTILPMLMYEQFGEKKYLEAQYESMRLHAECEIRKLGSENMGMRHDDLWLAPNLGDWLAPQKDIRYMGMHNGPVSNSFLIHDFSIMATTAEMLGKTADAVRYKEQYNKSVAAYIDAFVNPDGSMKDDYQGAYIMALAYVVPRGEIYNKILSKIVGKLKNEGMQTGFFATQHLLPLLCDNGYTKLCYDILLNEKCPGWLYQVNSGATTIWERWDALRPDGTVNEDRTSDRKDENMVSFNHYAFGSVGEFMYRYMLGIRPATPGFNSVLLAPYPDERISSVSGSYLSRAGKISVSYTYKNKQMRITFTSPVPVTLALRGQNEKHFKAGTHTVEAII